jgi:putative peptide zinc metalloprotease protein
LELLIRKPQGHGGNSGGFELKVLDRDETFLRLRPQRSLAVEVEENAIKEASGLVHVVRLKMDGTERYLKFTPEEYFLFRHMDGVHTVRDIAAAFFFEFNRFDPDALRGFLRKARNLGLVEVRRTSLLRSRRAEEEPSAWTRRVRAWEWRWRSGADVAFNRLASIVGLLYQRSLLPLHGVVAVMGLAVYGSQRWNEGLFAAVGWQRWLVVFLLLMPVTALVHELGHGLACKAAGRRVQGVGMAFLDDLVPSVYVDVSDLWMAGRWARIGGFMGGPVTNLVLGASFAVLAWASDHQGASFALTAAADAQLAVVLYTLWPFHAVREDGYEAFTDFVRVPALRGRAWRMMTGWMTEAPPDPGLTFSLRLLFAGWMLGLVLTLAGGATLVVYVVWSLLQTHS